MTKILAKDLKKGDVVRFAPWSTPIYIRSAWQTNTGVTIFINSPAYPAREPIASYHIHPDDVFYRDEPETAAPC